MLNDGILEESYSDYVNPLTLVHQEHKPPRMCLDARGVKRQMTMDRVKVTPIIKLYNAFMVLMISQLWICGVKVDSFQFQKPILPVH